MPSPESRQRAAATSLRISAALTELSHRAGAGDLLSPTDRKSVRYHALPFETRFALSWVPALGGCWRWIAGMKPCGYGIMRHNGSPWQAHRVAYTLHVGPIPDGLEIDHLCRNTACVNPDHLEAVSHAENLRRALAARAYCKSGRHQRTPENAFRTSTGANTCHPCVRESRRVRRVKRRAAALAAA